MSGFHLKFAHVLSLFLFVSSSGLDAKHGSINNYLKRCSDPAHAQEHERFIKALEKWVVLRNQGKTRIRDKQELLQDSTALEVVQRRGVRFSKPKMQFVEARHWDASYGPLDDSQVVEEMVHGVSVKGAWRLLGKVGHYEMEEFQDTEMSEHTRLANSSDPFGKHALAERQKALSQVLDEQSKGRAALAVEAKEPLSIQDVLSLVSSAAQGSGASSGGAGDGVDATAAKGASDKKVEVIDSDSDDAESSSCSGTDTRTRLAAAFSGLAPARATGAGTKGSAAGSLARSSASKRSAASSCSSKRSAATAGKLKFPASGPLTLARQDTAEFDGRFARLKESLGVEIGGLEATTAQVVFNEDDLSLGKAQWVQLHEAAQERGRTIASLLAKVRTTSFRVSRSRNSCALVAEEDRLEKLRVKLQQLAAFNTLLRKVPDQMDVASYVDAFDSLHTEVAFGPIYHVLRLRCACTQVLMFSNFEGFTSCFHTDGKEALLLKQASSEGRQAGRQAGRLRWGLPWFCRKPRPPPVMLTSSEKPQSKPYSILS